jgi:hypothetical protein
VRTPSQVSTQAGATPSSSSLRPRVVAVLVVTVVVVAAVLGRGGVAGFSDEERRQLVDLWLRHGAWGRPRSDEVVGTIAAIGARVAAPLQDRLDGRTPRFLVLRDESLAQSAALFDGTVVVTTGALRRLQDEAQCAALLAHALAHLALGDADRAIAAHPDAGEARAALSSSNAPLAARLLDAVAGAPTHGDEAAALDLAMTTLSAAGYPPAALGDAVVRMRALGDVPEAPWVVQHRITADLDYTLARASRAGDRNGVAWAHGVLDRIGHLTAETVVPTTAPPAPAAPPRAQDD